MIMNLENIPHTTSQLKHFESQIADLFRQGEVKGASHFSNGNEEQLIKIFRGLREGDFIYHSREKDYSRQELIDQRLIEIPDGLPSNHPVFSGIQQIDLIGL